MKFRKTNDHVRLAYSIVQNNHDFPSHLASKTSVFNWCEKNIIDADILSSFTLAWESFESMPFATINRKGKSAGREKKKLSY